MIAAMKSAFAKVWWVFAALLVLTAKKPNQKSQPIWSVPKGFRNIYFTIVTVLGGPPLCDIVAGEIRKLQITDTGWYDSFVQVVSLSAAAYAPIGLGVAISVFIAMHAGGPPIVLYQLMANKWLVPVIDAHERRGEERGEARGFNAGAQAMKDWYERKQAAEAQGLPFNDPQPGME